MRANRVRAFECVWRFGAHVHVGPHARPPTGAGGEKRGSVVPLLPLSCSDGQCARSPRSPESCLPRAPLNATKPKKIKKISSISRARATQSGNPIRELPFRLAHRRRKVQPRAPAPRRRPALAHPRWQRASAPPCSLSSILGVSAPRALCAHVSTAVVAVHPVHTLCPHGALPRDAYAVAT